MKKFVSKFVPLLILCSLLFSFSKINMVKASGTIYIRADGSVEGTDKIQRDGNVYTFTDDIFDFIVVERDNIVVDGAGCTLQGARNGTGITLSGRSNVTVANIKIKEFDIGILFNMSSNNSIYGNNIEANNPTGIVLEYNSNYNSVYGNNITNNDDGIVLWYSSNNSVYGNKLAANNWSGILLGYSSNNIISCNNASSNEWDGIHLVFSGDNNVSGNTVSKNMGRGGIRVEYSDNNRFSANTLSSNNEYGIYLEYSSSNVVSGNIVSSNNRNGIRLDHSHNNVIFHNSFTNYYQVDSRESMNTWDDGYPSGGNYWSDYEDRYPNATELDGSGIWNTPYVIDGNNQDNYPLMPYWVPPPISIVSPENKTYAVTDVPLAFTVSESTSWMGYSLDGQMNVTISGNTTIFGLFDGIHSITVYANYTAGNIGYSGTVFFTIDTSSPNIEILSPENRTYTASFVFLSLSIDEPTSWMGYSLDGQDNMTITGNTTISGLTNELHSLIVYANDTAGNIGSSNIVHFTILDSTPPSVSILSPKNKTYATTDIPLNFTIDEAVVWVAYNLDKKANMTITENTTLSGLSDGSHSLIVYAKDVAGNTGTSETIYFSIKTQQSEPFPTTWIAGAITIIAVVGAALLVYFAKIRKTTGKTEE